jgi:NADH-quinone oxidoreductase subunit M
MWGDDTELGNSRRATATFMIYTLAGSLLMLAAAVALGVLTATQNNVPISFLFTDLAANSVSHAAQCWIFAGFMLALLVKMPIPPFHGWMPITYKSTPLPVLIALSAVVAKLGAYGFLRVVLPLLPEGVDAFQPLLLILAIVGIIYGSVMAFSQDDTRLVVGYSSIAQIGFVLLGIFVIDAKGAEGAILQMINHGVVVIALFLIIAFLGERAGSEKLSDMGGLAKQAPLFATLFLIVALATLAMPGSANFVGETYILFGAFTTKFVWGVVASVGVVLAAVYMLRLYQRAMHNRGSVSDEETDARARELNGSELSLLLPAVLILLAMSIYPQYVVERVEPNAGQAIVNSAKAKGLPAVAEAKDALKEDGQ